jgi:hypothetical protein
MKSITGKNYLVIYKTFLITHALIFHQYSQKINK